MDMQYIHSKSHGKSITLYFVKKLINDALDNYLKSSAVFSQNQSVTMQRWSGELRTKLNYHYPPLVFVAKELAIHVHFVVRQITPGVAVIPAPLKDAVFSFAKIRLAEISSLTEEARAEQNLRGKASNNHIADIKQDIRTKHLQPTFLVKP